MLQASPSASACCWSGRDLPECQRGFGGERARDLLFGERCFDDDEGVWCARHEEPAEPFASASDECSATLDAFSDWGLF